MVFDLVFEEGVELERVVKGTFEKILRERGYDDGRFGAGS